MPKSIFTVDIVENITNVIDTNSISATIQITSLKTTREISGLYLSPSATTSIEYSVAPSIGGEFVGTNVQTAINSLIRRQSIGTSPPPSATRVEGDTFYDLDDDLFQVFINGTYVPLLVTGANSMTTIEGGTF